MSNNLHNRLAGQTRAFRQRRELSYHHQKKWQVEAHQGRYVLPEALEIPIPVLEGNGERSHLTLKINNGKERG